ncbi:MAG: hypothetical protein PHR20_01480 [Bacteroidales bacterium]|nr:hypothetical protein [Bacteroidales bacterium]
MKAKLLISTIIVLVFGLAGWGWLKFLMPQYYFGLYPLIPLFYLVLLFANYIVITRSYKKSNIIDIKTQWIIKGVKFALCVAFIILYIKLIAVNSTSFAITFVVFYCVYLFLESWLLINISKQNK